MSSNALLENLDRSVFTFNTHNLIEMCFNHVYKNPELKDKIKNPDQPLLE